MMVCKILVWSMLYRVFYYRSLQAMPERLTGIDMVETMDVLNMYYYTSMVETQPLIIVYIFLD